MSDFIIVHGTKYKILDALEYVTLADSFVKNKIGTGNGEAKLYVGNERDRLTDFFGDFVGKAFLLKEDLIKFLIDARDEYLFPQQQYKNKDLMASSYEKYKQEIEGLSEDVLFFDFGRSNVKPPRVYITSNSEYYGLIRKIGLPNISYISILKLESEQEDVFYYIKIFIDYSSDIIGYSMPEIIRQEKEIENDQEISNIMKEALIKSRLGQGEYRDKLLKECTFCPFTDVNDERMLIASHIKPWCKSNDMEKIDPKNGLILTPTYDKLFDKGFISFKDNKELLVSPWISPLNQKRLGIYSGKIISKLVLDEQRMAYLNYHRNEIFKS